MNLLFISSGLKLMLFFFIGMTIIINISVFLSINIYLSIYLGIPVYQYPAVPYCVLLATSWDYPSYLPGSSSTWQIRPLHHDSRYIQVNSRLEVGGQRTGNFRSDVRGQRSGKFLVGGQRSVKLQVRGHKVS